MRKVTQALVIAALAALVVAAPAFAIPNAPVGVVIAGQRASVGTAAAENGTSIFSGDVLATDPSGSLRVRFGGAQLLLGPNTMVSLQQSATGVNATLLRGTVRFASVAGSPVELHALKATVRPKTEDAIGQLTVLDPAKFQISSSKGALNVDVNGTDHVVNESDAYMVSLDENSDQQRPRGVGAPIGGGTSGGVWIVVAAIAAGTGIAIWRATVSPSKP